MSLSQISALLRASAVVIGLNAFFLLVGCESRKDADEVRAKLDFTQAEMSLVQQQVADLRSGLVKANVEIAAMKDKLADRDASAKKKAERPDGPPALTQEQITQLNQVISQCVQSVRGQAPKDYSGHFWTEFDAYYNPGTGRVVNNAIYNGSMPALYEFNKCVTSQGWSLG